MRYFSAYLFLIVILIFNSCSSSRKAGKSVAPSGEIPSGAVEYINKYSPLAVSEMQRTGIPASITLAQGMLESGYGRSTLAIKGNNHFGIKCHSDWTGAKIYHDDNKKGECFRAYRSVEDSYRDHSEFLVNGSRYRELFKLSSTDYKNWAHGLKKAGYATDPNYAHLLIRKIEEYGLDAFDTGKKVAGVSAGQGTPVSNTASDPRAATNVQGKVLATDPATVPSAVPAKTGKDADTAVVQAAPATTQANREEEAPIKVISLGAGKKVQENNGVGFIIAEEGDTFGSLAEKYQVLSWEISRYNDLNPATPLQAGQVIYLQPKRTRAAQGFSVHVVSAGETMHGISQKYAIKLSSLYKMNLMDEGSDCKPGQKLRIR